MGIDEDCATPRLVSPERKQDGAEAIEHRLAGVHPDGVVVALRTVDGQPSPDVLRVRFHCAEQGIRGARALATPSGTSLGGAEDIRGARTFGFEAEDAAGVALQAQTDQRGGGLDEAADIAGEQAAVLLPLHRRVDLVESAPYLAAAVQRALPLVDGRHLLRRQAAPELLDGGAGAVLRHRHLEIVLERHVLEKPPDDVEDLVRAELLADQLQLVEKDPEDPPFARLRGDQIDDHHGVAHLPVAVDAPHPLFEARRVPGHVVVRHQPAELEIDALARGVGGDQVAGPAPVRRTPEQLDLGFPLAIVEPAMDEGDLPGESEPFQSAHQELRGVAVLGEDDELLLREGGIGHDRAQLLEFGVLAGFGEMARPGEKRLDLGALLAKLRQGERDEAAEGGLLERLVTFPLAPVARGLAGVLVGGTGFEEVGRARDARLASLELLDPARAHERDSLVQAHEAALERAHQRVGGACEAALEHAHGEARGGAVQHPRLVPGLGDVARRRVVERPLARAQGIAERVAVPLRIERPAVEADHLLLGAANEVAAALRLRECLERVEGRERVGCEQPPQAVPGEVLAHVRRRGQQQDVRRRPAEPPACALRRQAGQRLGEAVAVGLADAEVLLAIGGELVGFVEHDEVVGAGGARGHRLAHPREHALAGERIDADDETVALRPDEGVAGAGVGAAHDPERETKQRAHLAFPVADQAGRGDHEDAGEETAREHLPHVEAGHDRLAGTGVVGEQEP